MALPPDVRRWLCPAGQLQLPGGLRPWFGLCPSDVSSAIQLSSHFFQFYPRFWIDRTIFLERAEQRTELVAVKGSARKQVVCWLKLPSVDLHRSRY
jgi:hypothetical protein